MKKLTILFILSALVISCKSEPKKEVKQEKFPEELGKVFEKHGGIDNWRAARTLSFNQGEEAHTVDLWTRKTVINSPNYSLGYDGKDIWLSQEDSTAFKSTPSFYYNLYFYFYAMPFVLADDGIVYEKTEPITFEGKEYPGIKISFEANKGSSPDDNYVVYYNKDTYQMEWLAYTVTFRSKKPSDRYSLIKYNTWETTDGFVLPKSLVWYKKDENGQPTEPARTPTNFKYPLIKKTVLPDSFYQKPSE